MNKSIELALKYLDNSDDDSIGTIIDILKDEFADLTAENAKLKLELRGKTQYDLGEVLRAELAKKGESKRKLWDLIKAHAPDELFYLITDEYDKWNKSQETSGEV